MVDKKDAILKEAFEEALETDAVQDNMTDNADEEISEAMAQYLRRKDEDSKLNQIRDFIRERTVVQDALLKESFNKAVEDYKTVERSDAEEIEREMKEHFRKQEEAIRTRRIHLYIQKEIERREALKKQQEQ